jgi:hypothetical protein
VAINFIDYHGNIALCKSSKHLRAYGSSVKWIDWRRGGFQITPTCSGDETRARSEAGWYVVLLGSGGRSGRCQSGGGTTAIQRVEARER